MEHLCAHGLELIFKADLRRSMSMDQIRKDYGHDLLKLRKNLSVEFTEHFSINDEVNNVINYLAIGHSGHYHNRYLQTGVRQSLNMDQILSPLTNFNDQDRPWLLSHFVEANP